MDGVSGRYNGLWNHTIWLLLFLAFASLPMEVKRIGRILKIFITALIPVAVYAIIQYCHLDPLQGPADRPVSTIGHPVILAALLGLATPFILSFLFQSANRIKQIYWGSLFAVFMLAVLTTLSRGPWISIAASSLIVIIFLLRDRKADTKKGLIIFLSVLTASALIVTANREFREHLMARFKTYAAGKADISIHSRYIYLNTAVRIVKDHPLTGVGFENFRIVYPQYRVPEENEVSTDIIPTMVHNGYLQTALTNGIPAVLIYLLLVGAVLVMVVRSYRGTSDRGLRLLFVGFIASITGFLIQDIFGWLEIALTPFFFIVLGLAVSLCMTGREKIRPSAWAAKAVYVLMPLCLITMAYLVNDSFNKLYADRLFWTSKSFMNIKDDWTAIESNISKGLKAVPDDFNYEDLAGILYLRRFDATGDMEAYKKGIEAIRKANLHNPFDIYVLIHSIEMDALALRKGLVQGPSRLSEEAATKLPQMDKNNPSVYEAIAKLRIGEKKYTESLECLNRAEALKPGEKRYHLLAGDIYRAMKEGGKAVASYRKAIALLEKKTPYPDEWALVKQAVAVTLLGERDYIGALREAGDIAAFFPQNVAAYIIMGDAYAVTNNLAKAKDSFAAALKIDPSNPYAKRGLEQVEKMVKK